MPSPTAPISRTLTGPAADGALGGTLPLKSARGRTRRAKYRGLSVSSDLSATAAGHAYSLIPSQVTHTGERDVMIFTDLAAIGVSELHVSKSPVWNTLLHVCTSLPSTKSEWLPRDAAFVELGIYNGRW